MHAVLSPTSIPTEDLEKHRKAFKIILQDFLANIEMELPMKLCHLSVYKWNE